MTLIGEPASYALIWSKTSGNWTSQVWDPASRTFSISRNQNPVMGATLLDDGRIYLTGGLSNSSWAGIYDPISGATIPAQAPTAFRPTTTRLSDGRVLIVGGLLNGHLRAVPTVQIFQWMSTSSRSSFDSTAHALARPRTIFGSRRRLRAADDLTGTGSRTLSDR
jgi:hypothetical protein